jgi:DNA-binding transcriptional ArsR family regulator
MMASPLEAIVKHDGRLDILCCLLDGGPRAIMQLSAQTGMSPAEVGHHIELLNLFDLAERADGVAGEPLYQATLENRPDWVRQAVERHRRP